MSVSEYVLLEQRWASSSRIDAFLDLSPVGPGGADSLQPLEVFSACRLYGAAVCSAECLSPQRPCRGTLTIGAPRARSSLPADPSPLPSGAFCCSHYREAPVSVCHDVPLGPGGPLRVACWWWLHGLSAFCPLLSGAREVVLCMHINLETSVFLMALVQRKLGLPRILRFLPLNCFAYVLLFRRFWGSHLGCVPFPNAAPCASGPRRIWYLVRAQNGWGRRACCH